MKLIIVILIGLLIHISFASRGVRNTKYKNNVIETAKNITGIEIIPSDITIERFIPRGEVIYFLAEPALNSNFLFYVESAVTSIQFTSDGLISSIKPHRPSFPFVCNYQIEKNLINGSYLFALRNMNTMVSTVVVFNYTYTPSAIILDNSQSLEVFPSFRSILNSFQLQIERNVSCGNLTLLITSLISGTSSYTDVVTATASKNGCPSFSVYNPYYAEIPVGNTVEIVIHDYELGEGDIWTFGFFSSFSISEIEFMFHRSRCS